MSDQNEELSLPEEMKNKPVPFQFFISIADALEARIDYNFNSVIQISMLVEYLYKKLAERDIDIELDEEFAEFQETRFEEIKKQFEEAQAKQASPEDVARDVMNSIQTEDD
jgi:hypothetical protein